MQIQALTEQVGLLNSGTIVQIQKHQLEAMVTNLEDAVTKNEVAQQEQLRVEELVSRETEAS